MGWLARGLGQFGSDVGQGYDINLGWKERLQQMALENARQKLADLMGPLQVQQLQQEIKQRGAPQYEGTINLPGGGVGAISRAPDTGAISMNQVVPGAVTADFVGRQILNARGMLTAGDQQYADLLLGNLRNPGIDPAKVLEAWERFLPGAAKKTEKQKPPVVNVDKGLVTVYDEFGNGTDLPIYDAKGNVSPDLPKEIQPLVASQINASNVVNQRKMNDEAAIQKAQMDRLIASQDFQNKRLDEQNRYRDADTALGQAIAAMDRYEAQEKGYADVLTKTHLYQPWTLWNPGYYRPLVEQAKAQAEMARQDAIAKLKAAGEDIPTRLQNPVGSGNATSSGNAAPTPSPAQNPSAPPQRPEDLGAKPRS